jgi:hypothetical protein
VRWIFDTNFFHMLTPARQLNKSVAISILAIHSHLLIQSTG